MLFLLVKRRKKGGRGGRQGRSKSRGKIKARIFARTVHQPVVAQLFERLHLRQRETTRLVRATKLQTADREEKGKHFNKVHIPLFGHAQVLQQQRPQLGVDILQQKLETSRSNVEVLRVGRIALHEACALQQKEHRVARRCRLLAADHKVEDGLPLRPRILVEELDADLLALVFGVGGAERVKISTA